MSLANLSKAFTDMRQERDEVFELLAQYFYDAPSNEAAREWLRDRALEYREKQNLRQWFSTQKVKFIEPVLCSTGEHDVGA